MCGGVKKEDEEDRRVAVEGDVELAVVQHDNALARRRAADGGVVAVGNGAPPGGDAPASGEEDDDDASVWVKRHSAAHDTHFWENTRTGESTWVRPVELGESDGGTDEEETSDDDENVTNGHPTKEWKRHYHEEHGAYFWQHKGTSTSLRGVDVVLRKLP